MNLTSLMRGGNRQPEKMTLKRFKRSKQWYADCPCCPVVSGWFVGTHADAVLWVAGHIAFHQAGLLKLKETGARWQL